MDLWENALMANRRQHAETGVDTASRILDVAEKLVQIRGFNGFSYADIASELQITKAGLHYHFAGKAELGEALVVRYAARFAEALATLDTRNVDAPTKLESYADLYGDVLRDNRMCLCGVLAAEYPTLPAPMHDAVVSFFDANEAWLSGVLNQGVREGTLNFDGEASEVARTLIGGLEGALLVARPYGDPARFQDAARRLLGSLAHKAT